MEQENKIARQLETILPAQRIKSRLIDLVSYASDAGFYRLIPKAVVQPLSEDEIVRLFRFSHQQKVPLVFRTGGTSLSGQSITDGILVDLSQFWNKIQVEDHGNKVRVQPGITGGMVNIYLKKYQRKIGPDPSSISAAMMGGILSNNSSGMCCGVTFNSYHTTLFIKFILPGGQTFTTENPEDYDRFSSECSGLSHTLVSLRNQVLSDEALFEKIRKKYTTKNTVGYSLNALIDFEHPLDIFAHLLIGAEGTLAFISEAVLKTIPEPAFKATSLLYFEDIYKACKAIQPLIDAGAVMVELMDRASLRAIEDLPGISPEIKLLPASAAALLIEFQEESMELLEKQVDTFLTHIQALDVYNAPVFTTDEKERAFFWKIRKGLFPAVGAVRKSGTTVVLEDVAFPLEHLGDAVLDLQNLFQKFGYNNAIIFGHAKDGNIHFVITQSFNTPSEINHYDHFLKEVVELVVEKYNGTLKAEHGTGRNMAPFVETEWGGAAYDMMKRIKEVVDPEGLLNPGVIINADKKAHIKYLKSLPSVEEEVDRCIECGYCEPVCPSRNLTLTPRRRIVVRRELKQLQEANRQEAYSELLGEYQYDGLDTCAVDGLCAGSCPVFINTGDLVKRLRRESHNERENHLALRVARNFSLVEKAARTGLYAGSLVNKIFGAGTMTAITKGMRKLFSSVPLWSKEMPAPPSLHALHHYINNHTSQQAIVYFPSCISRVMGSNAGKKTNIEVFMSVSAKAGIAVKLMSGQSGTCCGQIFSSKGFQKAYQYMADDIVHKLWSATNEGQLPVVIDVSSCVYTLKNLRKALSAERQRQYDQLVFLDSVDYLHDYVLPAIAINRKKEDIVLHPVCAVEKLGTTEKLVQVARLLSNKVTLPVHAGCCGMAGDRGFLFPELTHSATKEEAEEVCSHPYDGYYSTTRTCEIALSEATGANYESILYLVDELSG